MPQKPIKTTRKSKATAKSSKVSLITPRMTVRPSLLAVFILIFCILGGYFIYQATHAATPEIALAYGGLCLDDKGNQTANNSTVDAFTCNGTPAQHWVISGNQVKVNNMCLDAYRQGKTNGTRIDLFPCNGGTNQQWRRSTTAARFELINVNANKCLDDTAYGGSGTALELYTCVGQTNQLWSATAYTAPTKPATTPPPSTGSTTGSTTSGQAMPVGNLTGWKQIFADDFTTNVPLGAFSNCNNNTDTPQAYCSGLAAYPHYYSDWWAYPAGWPDTAKSGADGNGGAPFGGQYHPEDTVSVSGGQMHVHMYRPASGGDNHVAAVVPKLCMNQEYGRYVERFRVSHADPGFKSAHLFYQGGYEIDYPENDYGTSISAYTHPGGANFSTNSSWTSWHTTTIEWTPSSVKFYMDGSLIGTTTSQVPHIRMSWILQNESSIMGPYAKPGASAQLDTDWVTCYAQG